MPGMSRKEISRLLDHITPQGVEVTRTKKGFLLRLPDGGSTMIHLTGSDHREADNVRARLKRSGVTWPTDGGDDLRADVTGHPPRRATLERVLPVLERWPSRYITAAQLMRFYAAETDDAAALTQLTAQRVLYHSGWTATGKTTARKWLRPLSMEPDLITETEAAEAAEAVEAVEAVDTDASETVETTEAVESPVRPSDDVTPLAGRVTPDGADSRADGAPVASETGDASLDAPPAREFIDTHGSWTIDAPNQYITVTQLFDLLHAVGLRGEIRVWRE